LECLTRRTFTQLASSAVSAGMLRPGSASSAAAPATDLTSLTLAEASGRLRDRSVTAVELTEACYARIDIYGRKLNAFVTLTRDAALAQARALDGELEAGRPRSPLHGVPLAIKDNIDTAGVRTTAASGVYKDRVPVEDAVVVERLKRAGAIVLGKTNLQEFALGAGDISYYGPARNPWALDHGTGGSSSGSGAAVASNLCFGALGTDTAGSIRQPASLCGIVGLKPTYGLVSIRGIVPLIASLDHCGPLARTVEDAAMLLDQLAGYDRLDPHSVEHAPTSYVSAMKQPVSNLRLGLPETYFDDLDPEVAAAVKRAVDVLAAMTKGAKPVRLPAIPPELSSLGPLGAEAYAYHETLLKNDPGGYQPTIRTRLQSMGKSSAGDYIRARLGLETLRRTVDQAFSDFDLVVLPTERGLPPLLNDMIERSMHPSTGAPAAPGLAGSGTANLAPFDAFGVPAISVPCGFSRSGLPIGLTIAGPHFSEARVLALAAAYEAAARWTDRRPPLTPDMPVPVVSGYSWNPPPGA
jgi:aspartyl-tRNA(Asn)/glutamyl-tRNA(Gln) amidotransferase subunit A